MKINSPYSGTMVPMGYFEINKQVQSIMLEVNRALYLNEPTNDKSNDFRKIQLVIGEYIEVLRGIFGNSINH